MDRFLFANEASAKLAAPLPSGATSLTLDDAAAFPTPGADQCFYATLFEPQADGTQMRVEIVKVTARSGNTLTIVRDVESTAGQSGGYAYPSASGVEVRCELRLTAGVMKEMLQKADASSFAAASHTHSKDDVGLGNVDNTSDADKPVSTAQAKAIADAVGGIRQMAQPALVTEAAQAALAQGHYVLAYDGAVTVSAPAQAQAGDRVWITVTNDRKDNVFAGGGKNVMGLNEPISLDMGKATYQFIYLGEKGWWVA